VLEGVSAGVMGLDANGRITLINRSACAMLGGVDTDYLDRPLDDAIPAFAELIADAFAHRGDRIAGEVQLREPLDNSGKEQASASSGMRTIQVRAQVMLDDSRRVTGAIVTFDDMTRLVSAQRMAAWGDVARRIAHEIKNPLTPIQLSAERLQRKYRTVFEDDKVFAQCTDTIIRHVGDIGRMVDEFSSFARMPLPVMASEDLGDIAKQSVFLHEVAHTHIKFGFETDSDDGQVRVECDRRLIAQAMTNLLKNAVESIDGRKEAEGDDVEVEGQIDVSILRSPDWVDIRVRDNGKGLPAEDRNKLTEPYVTTRSKGTGLGLAIVKKIMEDHGGTVLLEDNIERAAQPENGVMKQAGATVILRFPATALVGGSQGGGGVDVSSSTAAE